MPNTPSASVLINSAARKNRDQANIGTTILSDHRHVDLQNWDQRHRSENRDSPTGPLLFVTQLIEPLKPGKALDLACGTGRHAIWLARQGWTVTAVDGSQAAIEILREQIGTLPIETRIANLERHEFSIAPESWDLILVSLYLQRDLFEPAKLGVKPGGVLVAITLLAEAIDPPQHRLLPGELKSYFTGWEILEYFEGLIGQSNSQARIAARKPS
jgi:tellurite methyltransferase